MLNAIFEAMARAGASDLHWTDGEAPRFRVHGTLVPAEIPEMARAAGPAELARTLAGAEAYRRFLEEKELDGAADVAGGRRIRYNLFFAGERVSWAVRLLPDTFIPLEKLGLSMRVLDDICALEQGLVLVTGATGSGKTTTIASVLNRINEIRPQHILTIEDPVEYVHVSKRAKVSQREVGRDTRDFARALRSALREDPDVILLGEMRDRESMDMALTLAETGHLTFATLHTAGAAETVSRIVSAFGGPDAAHTRERLAANLRYVISQRLVPWPDGRGRSLAAEVLVTTPAVRALIRDGKERQLPSLLETGSEYGMVTMSASLAALK